MKRIAIYTRRSVYSEESESINMQVNACKEYFKRQDCKFEVFIDEGFSGSNIDRPAFIRMRNQIHKSEFDKVVVYKIDRISRNMVDFINLVNDFEQYEVPLISVTEGADPTTPAGKFVMNILASVAEMERANIQQRVTDNMLMLAKQGRWTGGNTPTGYKSIKLDNGFYLSIDEDIGSLVEDIYTNYLECNSLNEVSRAFDISVATISDILSSPVYVGSSNRVQEYLRANGFLMFGEPNGKGYLTYGKRPNLRNRKQWKTKGYIVAVSKHKPLIDENKWLKVQTILKKNSIDPRPKESAHSYLNTLVKCAQCSANMNIDLTYVRVDGTKVYSFRCGNKKRDASSCNNGLIMISKLESSIEDKLKKMGLDREFLMGFFETRNDKDYKKEKRLTQNKINKNNTQINNLTDKLALLSNEASASLIVKIENLTSENIKLQHELVSFENLESDRKISEDRIDKISNSIQLFNTMGNASIEDKRVVIRNIIEKIDFDRESNKAEITLRT